jgi:TatD DNase family protein
MTLIDSHCHLDAAVYDADREAVIRRARDAGVECMVAIGSGDGPPDLEAGLRLAAAYDFIYATAGVHPHDASKATEETWSRLADLTTREKLVAIGEIGLDYHYDNSPRETQRAAFARQLEVAREAGLPIVIHTREAWADTLSLLQAHWPADGPGGIFHCFSEGPAAAERALGLGFLISFSGILTFPKADDVRAALRETPLDRLLIETDAPYLAPVPWRGKRNEPAYVVETATKVAEIKGLPLEQVAAATSSNWKRLCLQETGQDR